MVRTLIAGAVGILLLVIALHAVTVRTVDGAFRREGEQVWQPTDLPLRFHSDREELVQARLTVLIPPIRPRLYRFVPDDCVEAISVNGIPFESDHLPFCDYGKGRVFDLGSALRAGENVIQVTIRNHGGPGALRMEPDRSDPLSLALRLALAGVILATVLELPRRKNFFLREGGVLMAFVFGMVLRLYYLVITPFAVRGHDTDGHIEYIEYIAQNWAIPPLKGGWEFYHPPLYYAFWAVWMKLAELLGATREAILADIQTGSLLISILSLLIAAWVAPMIFSEKKQSAERFLFVLTTAVFPGLLFNAARINNDVFIQFFSFLALACLLTWWTGGGMHFLPANAAAGSIATIFRSRQKMRPPPGRATVSNAKWWYLAVAFVSLASLSKANALLLIPVLGLCLLLRKGESWKRRAVHGIGGASLFLLLTGWYAVYRIGFQGQRLLTENLTNLNSGLRVSHALTTLGEFNPFRIIGTPFNNAWSDEAGRQYFWEYFFRSAFFGEFGFGDLLEPVAALILLIAIILLPVTIVGAVRMAHHKVPVATPLLVTTAILLLGHMLYRQEAPFSSSQDFRYSLLLVLPLTAFVIEGLGKSRTLRTLLCVLLSLCTAFLLMIPMGT